MPSSKVTNRLVCNLRNLLKPHVTDVLPRNPPKNSRTAGLWFQTSFGIAGHERVLSLIASNTTSML